MAEKNQGSETAQTGLNWGQPGQKRVHPLFYGMFCVLCLRVSGQSTIKKHQMLPELQPSSSNHLLIAVPNISVLSVEKTFHLELRIL